jgi:hypothetical protein
MNTTVGTLRKDIEKKIESLSPKEKAQYICGEWWRIAKEVSLGSDITAQVADLETIEHKYITSMGPVDFIHFSQELWKLDTREWVAHYFYSYLAGLGREEILITLLLIEKNNYWMDEIHKSDKEKKSRVWKKRLEMYRQHSQMLTDRRCAIKQEVKDILAADFWDIQNIPRPMDPIPEPDMANPGMDLEDY